MSEAALELDNIENAAILLLTIGEAEAAEVLKHLEQREIHRISEAMSGLQAVSTDQIDVVVDEFLETVADESGLTLGAGRYIKNTLTNALGENKANSVMEKISGGSTAGLDKLRWMDPRAIAEFIVGEHPQIQAIVLSYLEPDHAAQVIAHIPEGDMRRDIMMRVANLESIPPAAIAELAKVLEEQVSSTGPTRFAQLGGKRTAADILNNMAKDSNEAVMESIREADGELGEAINELMFVFDNVSLIDDRGIQTLLKEVSTDVLTLALKGAEPSLQDKIFVDPAADDPLKHSAGSRDGAMSILIGIAARKSIEEKRAVKIAELTDLEPMARRP